MKSAWTLFFLVFTVFFHCFGACAQNNTIVFLTDEHKEGGYLEAITTAALQRVGYKTEIHYVPWARALKTVMEGQSEALMSAYYTEERAEKMMYTDSIGQTEIVFFARKGADITYATLEDLKPYRIGMIRGAAISAEFDASDYLQKEEVSSPDLNIKKLLNDRIDLFVEQRQVVLNYLRNQFPEHLDAIVALEPPLSVSKYYNAFSKAYPNYEEKVQDFNRGMEMIRSDGTYQDIMRKYEHP